MTCPPLPTALSRRHLIDLEPALGRALSRLLSFTSHSLYFPTSGGPEEPQWLPRERTLLLPLRRRGELLGVLAARGADGRAARRLLPSLPALLDLCLDNLELTLQSRTDALTGLALPHVLLERMSRDADAVRGRFTRGGDAVEDGAPLHLACAGLVVARWPDMRGLAAEHGYAFVDSLLAAMAAALGRDMPDESSAARTGDDEFTLHLPAAAPGACRTLAAAVLARLDAAALPHPVTRLMIRPRCVVGYALYPQDMDAALLPLPMREQARVLLHKARLAAETARERPDGTRIMGYGQIVSEGGLIRERRPLDRLLTSLGRHVGAAEGQRFSLWSPDKSLYKGEVVLLEVRDAASTAEILHTADPALPPEPGDAMTLLSPGTPLAGDSAAGAADLATGLLRHGDFLRRLDEEISARSAFCLALARLDRADAGAAARLATLCRPLEVVAGGRYGEASLVFAHDGGAESLERAWAEICESARGHGLDVAVGLAAYPFLSFRKGQMLECCRKALELAMLLPHPRVGVFGSLALNISADKQYAQGDVFGAVEEYRMALLADADNALAWNSLGVCMAALSRPHEALRYFLEARKRKGEDASILYNLGAVCQSLGETRAAARWYRQCVKTDAGHYFAHIRLGQLAEKAGRTGQAGEYYARAAGLEDDAACGGLRESLGGVARRHLARLALRRRKGADARELLHEALVRNPDDAAAMEMLAAQYLDGGEDPAMAELLARKSVALRPESRPAWLLLARALRALGREDAAATAEARAQGTGSTGRAWG